jgi:hypothetical protein
MPEKKWNPAEHWETRPWKVEAERNVEGRVTRARVLAAEERVVFCATFITKNAERDRSGKIVSRECEMTQHRHSTAAVVADCGITYAGLSSETLIAQADLIAAAPELYDALEALRNAVKTEPAMNHQRYDSLGIQVNAALAKARGESV